MPLFTPPPISRGRPANADSSRLLVVPGVAMLGAITTSAISSAQDIYAPFLLETSVTLAAIKAEFTVAAAAGKVLRAGIYAADLNWQPSGAPVIDAGTVAVDGTPGVLSWTAVTTLNPGRYLGVVNGDGAPTMRAFRASAMPGMGLSATLGASPGFRAWSVARTGAAAFPTPGSQWTAVTGEATGFYHYLVYDFSAVT